MELTHLISIYFPSKIEESNISIDYIGSQTAALYIPSSSTFHCYTAGWHKIREDEGRQLDLLGLFSLINLAVEHEYTSLPGFGFK